MAQQFVFHCFGFFEGSEFPLAMFDNEDSASDFCIEQECGTYVDLHYVRIPIYSSLQEFNDR